MAHGTLVAIESHVKRFSGLTALDILKKVHDDAELYEVYNIFRWYLDHNANREDSLYPIASSVFSNITEAINIITPIESPLQIIPHNVNHV